ncbi:MAG: hypothetical protein RMJ60_05570, partial [Anaerolineales bacterium]|nr:hypothetical protein [Anaerolineales bacterium]
MMAEILLDPQGDLPAPTGVQIVESEVDFLRYATSGQPLLIGGERLCQWAQDFYTLRGVPVKTVESPCTALQRIFPALSSEQAKELAWKIGHELLSKNELSSVFVLNACFREDYALWQGKPSLHHAARWLLWWLKHDLDEAEAVILDKFAHEMQNQAGNGPIAELYRVQNASQAQALIFCWLGADEKRCSDWGEFPLELPTSVLNRVKDNWIKRIITTNGNFFSDMLAFPLPLTLRQELARLTAEYYHQNPHQLNRAAFQQLDPYLDARNLAELEKVLPPSIPSSLPDEETAVLEWFENEYLPYRRWQSNFGDESARQVAVQHAQTFARWLLERYPHWLLEGEYLAFQKSSHLTDPNALILCIILDGLPAWDAGWIIQELSARTPRLTLLQKAFCFTALPTVTEFAKEALLRGVPPIHAPQTPPLGKILPDNRSPSRCIKEVAVGQVWFWRVEQPDKAYHFEREDKRERKVQVELQSILEEIRQVVQDIPDTVRLNILLTSDHGRLMNPITPCQLKADAGMQTHGRAAWGKIERNFPESGFVIDKEN